MWSQLIQNFKNKYFVKIDCFTDNNKQGDYKVMVCYNIRDMDVIAPFFFKTSVNKEKYLAMLDDDMIQALDEIGAHTQHLSLVFHIIFFRCHLMDDKTVQKWTSRKLGISSNIA